MFNGPISEGSYTALLRWYALSSFDLKTMAEMSTTYKLKNGTRSLVQAIAKDVKGKIKLSAAVKEIRSFEGAHEVITNSGESYHASVVIVTVPFRALNSIKFTPELSDAKQHIAKEGQTSRGIKVWARLEGQLFPYVAFAPGNSTFSLSKYEGKIGEDSLVVALGADAEKIDPENIQEVERELQKWLPEVKVLDATGHNWVEDEFAQETWTILKTNQFSRYHSKLREEEQGIYLAGSNYATGWSGFMDGAIQDGMEVSHKIIQTLSKSYL